MVVATSGYMAVIVDFPGLVAARRQADPGANRAGLLEVAGIFNGSGERGCGDRTDTGDRHEYAACLALTCIREELAPKLGGAGANAAPGSQHRQHDGCKPFVIGKKALDVILEGASLSGRNEKTEGFHDSTNLVGKLGGDPDQPGACRHERSGQHAIEAFYTHLTKVPDFREKRQAIGVIRVGFVRRHIERSFGMAGIDADRRHSFCA